MRFVYTAAPYHTFRGYVFANGAPVNVTDRATEELLKNDPAYRVVDEAKRPVLTVKRK